MHERRFLFRNCALELFFDDGQGFFLTFSNDRQAEALGDLAERARTLSRVARSASLTRLSAESSATRSSARGPSWSG